MGSELTDLGVCEAAAAIAAGEVSSSALVDCYLERIERVSPALNAFRTVMDAHAREAASAADEAVEAGAPLGPLHGVPVAVKDNIEVKGVPMTAGTRVLSGCVAGSDAFVVRALRAAGAVIIGKLHMAEWAIGGTTQNIHFGDAHNPWDLRRSAGGSSGGSGAAVAADLAPVALGTDTGGSVRIPAALNGLVGLRPTCGRVSNAGAIPVSWTFDTIGPLARRAEDVGVVLKVIAGFDPDDPVSVERSAQDFGPNLRAGVRGLRIGVLVDDELADRLAPEIASALDDAARVFESIGASLRSVALHGTRAIVERTAEMLLAEAAAVHEQRLRESPEIFAADVLTRLRRGASVSGSQYARARQDQRRWTRAVQQALGEVDVLLAPSTPIAAPLLADSDPLETTATLSAHLAIFSFARVPALAVPVGFSSGLPLGMQLVGRHFEEWTLLRAAHAYQSVTDWHLRHAIA